MLAQGLRRDSVSGASAEEIAHFAAEQGVTQVPAAVDEVLRLIGRQPGLWFDGAEFGVLSGIDDAVKRHVITRSVVGVEHGIRDLAGILVLSARQGYVYHILDGADLGHDDPPVWEIVEGASSRSWPTTSAWLSDMEPLVESLRRDLERYELNGWERPTWGDDILPRTAKGLPSEHPGERVRNITETAYSAGLRRSSVKGASEDEIDRFGAEQGVQNIPTAVREILRSVGREPGYWMFPMKFGTAGIDSESKRTVVAALRGMKHDLIDPEGTLLLAAYPDQTYYVIDGADLLQDDPPVWTIGIAGPAKRVRKEWASTTSWFEAMAPDIPRARRSLARFEDQGRPIPAWADFLEPEK
ncbi:SMI1/KNR4 family protein [Nocardia sp. NPDC056000]|uniref:SMI1/KNR4 family protein n=1 Tax=Nocardia sp. NPDC056000 TaxID=3345674 RepID=UPI0035DC12BC